MKSIVQKFANRCGYHISRFCPPPPPIHPAFAEMRRLCRHVDKPIIFDVGAHHGQTALALRELLPTSVVYAFEPFAESFERLKANTAQDSRINVFNYGLSEQEGEVSFYANRNSATNSLLPTDELGVKTWGPGLLENQEVVSVHVKTLDSVVEEMQIPRIDILKLDVQGAEHLVMKGAVAACRRRVIHLVYSEIITQPTYRGQKRLDESLAVFFDNGFDLHSIYDMSLARSGFLRQMDAMFCNGEFGASRGEAN